MRTSNSINLLERAPYPYCPSICYTRGTLTSVINLFAGGGAVAVTVTVSKHLDDVISLTK